MAIPKQPVSLFFGATDQDTGKKGVKLGNLTLAENVQQIKGGEFSKRYGFTHSLRTYAGQASLNPDSVVSPDGFEVLTRDATTDHVFARGNVPTANIDKGDADRFVPYVVPHFPALGSGLQQAPMAKQFGKYVVYLKNESVFNIVEVNPQTSAADDVPTWGEEGIVFRADPVSVSWMSGQQSNKVRSFAVVDYTAFDPDNLWIFWVDWSKNIYSWKVPHADLNTGTFHVVFSATETSQYKKYFTSISAGIVGYTEGITSGYKLAIAACGVGIDTTASFFSPGVGGDAATGFRYSDAGHVNNYGQSFAVHGHFNPATAEFTDQATGLLESVFGRQVACSCSIATVLGFQGSQEYWSYAFYGVTTSGAPGAIVVKVKISDLSFSTYQKALTLADPDDYGKPSNWYAGNWTLFGWFYNAQLTAKETATGYDIAVTAIPYYPDQNMVFHSWNPDYLQTSGYSVATATGTWTTNWTKLGCAVAQGWFRPRDHQTETSGNDYLLTVWEDKESLQTCYHVRKWETGEIVAQLAYGTGAHVGHTGTRDIQAANYVSDMQHPMLCNNNVNSLRENVIVGLQSANQVGSVDVAEIILMVWDHSRDEKPRWQNMQPVMGFALSPGPIPTIFNGFQQLREAGPLVYPSKPETFLGVGSS